jgi:hypothetical protein
VSHGHEVVPRLVLVDAETLTSALLVAIRPAQITDACLYVCKRDMKGSLVASLIDDRCLQVRELICQWNQWPRCLFHDRNAVDHIVKGGILLTPDPPPTLKFVLMAVGRSGPRDTKMFEAEESGEFIGTILLN